MPTLYVENVPDDLYEAFRGRAKEKRRSIAAEVVSLLGASIPTKRELKARKKFLRTVERLHRGKRKSRWVYPSTEEMQREGRQR